MSYFTCDVCYKGNFKSKAGLLGHQKIVHGIYKHKVYLDEVGEHLAALEKKIQEFHNREVDAIEKRFTEINKSWKQCSFNVEGLGKRLSGLESGMRILAEGLDPFIKELEEKYPKDKLI